MRPYVKICGITNEKDARLCVRHGADALGFIFYRKSPRYVPPAQAASIIASLPPRVTPVGVFVNASRRTINRIATQTGIRAIQLSGDESAQDCAGYALPVIKAFRARGRRNYGPRISAALLDGAAGGLYGGTGKLADFAVAVQMKKQFRLILAGGLSPDNVTAAIRRVRPFAVDVCSGVESQPGRKDARKVRQFLQQVRSVRT